MIGFADPVALAFAVLAAVLIAFHLREQTRRVVIVPSLLLWQALRQDVLRARRFRPDVLFFVQLLLLLALVAALARPYVQGEPGVSAARVILLLDVTASMQAMEGHRSRFELARERAIETVAELGPADEVMLITAGRQPQVVVGFTREHEEVARALRRAAPEDTRGNLALAVELADGFRQRSDVPARIAVFTDAAPEELPAAARDGVRVFQFGETDDNIGIESLQVFQGRFQDHRSARAYVSVGNFSHGVKHGVLTIDLNDRVIDRRGFTIPPRESAAFLIPHLPGPGMLRAALDSGDALRADDVAHAWVQPAKRPRVLLVSPPGSLAGDLRRVAAANGLEIIEAQPRHFEPRMAVAADLTIFHQFVPAEEPGGNILYVFPPDSDVFRIAGEVEHVEILDWDARHPVLAEVEPQATLPLRRVRITALPSWAQPLLWARAGQRDIPLAFAGEREGRRVGFLGFDLDSERLLANDGLDLFLFFMNLLAWLLPDDGTPPVLHTGDVWSWEGTAGETLLLRDPRGGELVLPAHTGAVELPYAGRYTVEAGGEPRVVLANLFDAAESDIGRGARRPVDDGIAPVSKDRRDHAPAGHRPLAPWLLGIAAALFAGEWLLAWRPR